MCAQYEYNLTGEIEPVFKAFKKAYKKGIIKEKKHLEGVYHAMKKDINNIHDKSYKTLFSNKQIFLNLINEFTENEWKKDLQADKLILVDKSYILSDYEELEADIVYRANMGHNNRSFFKVHSRREARA